MPKRSTYPKICPKCKALKPKSEYKPRQDSSRACGFKIHSYCFSCLIEYEKIKTDKNRKQHCIWARRSRLKMTFGLSDYEYAAKLTEQKHKCSICKTQGSLGLDHCHRTGLVRDFLCKKCNTIIGYAKDKTSILKAAIKYLERHRRATPKHQ